MMLLSCILGDYDENQHKYYNEEDEVIRYDDIYLATGDVQKMLFIRFNPDGYIDSNDMKHKAMLDSKGFRNVREVKLRTNVLVEEMKRHIRRIEKDENSELNEIHKLFYDGTAALKTLSKICLTNKRQNNTHTDTHSIHSNLSSVNSHISIISLRWILRTYIKFYECGIKDLSLSSFFTF